MEEMITNVSLVKDTIVVENDGATYLYAQATHKVAKTPPLTPAIQEYLFDRGFFDEMPRSRRYHPPRCWAGLMLLLGNACPLACRYCYAHGGRNGELMSPAVADQAVEAYLSQGARNPKVTFFGGGEPSANVLAIKHVVRKYGGRIKWQITTCGVMAESFLQWLIDNGVGITISLDGPPLIQNDLRPLRGGGQSAHLVERTIATLIANGRSIGVRATITKETLAQLDSVLDYFDSIGAARVHLECLYPLGRASDIKASASDGMSPISVSDRVDMLLRGLNWALSKGKRLRMSGLTYLLNPRITGYCGPICGQTMVVNHFGQLTACSEVIDEQFAEWPIFHLGRVTPNGQLELMQKNLEHLQNRRVTTMALCRSCFARHICRGGCAHKAWADTGDVFTPGVEHCSFVRTAVPLMIRRMAERAGSS